MAQKEEVILEILVDYQKGLSAIGEYKDGIHQLKVKQEQYKKELDAGRISKDNYSKAVTDSKIRVKEFENAIRIVTKELQNNLKQEKAAANSMDGMKARLSNLTAAYSRLGDAQEDAAKKQKIGDEIRLVTEKLNAEEQALGNFRRQVGNYEVATKSLRSELRELTEQLTSLKLEGKDGTEEYMQLAKKVSLVKDAVEDVNREVGGGASDTRGLDQVKGSVDLLAGSFTALNSIQGIFGEDSKKMEAIVQKIQIGIGALSAATAIQNGLQKEGAVVQGILRMQSWAATKAIVAQTGATRGATVTQKIFNAVAKANPYVLLAMALITVVGALAAFALGTDKAIEKQNALNALQKNNIDALERYGEEIKDKHKPVIKALEDEIALKKAQGATEQELEPLHEKLHQSKMRMHNQLKGFYADEIHNINKNKTELKSLRDQMTDLQNTIARGGGDATITINGKVMTDDAEDLVDILQSAIDNVDKKVTIGVQAKSQQQEEEKAEALRKATADKVANDRAIELSKERKQKEIEAVRAMEDAILSIVKDAQEKEINKVNLKYARQLEDLQTTLKTETNLTAKAKEALNNTIKALDIAQKQDLANINAAFSKERFAKEVEEQRLFIEERLLLVKEGSLQEHQLKMQQIELAMEEEIRANSEKEERLRIDEQLIRDKYAAEKEVANKDRLKKDAEQQLSETKFAVENKFLQSQLNDENELQAKLEAKRAEIEALTRLEDEGDQEFLNKKLQLASQEKDIIKDIADTKTQQTQDMLTAIGGAFGAISGLLENMAEDNEALASFAKVLAMFEIGINTAIAISSAIKTATQSSATVWDMIAGIAAGVIAVVSAMTQANALINKQKEPKAPKMNKYATGGLVSGPGSGTSDNVPSMLSNGESVMTALTTSMFAPILSSFNQIGGGVPIQIQQTGSQIMGEDMLARAFAKGAASLPAPVVSVEEINRNQARTVQIEQLRTVG